MATIQSLGIGSGLLTSELLEGLLEAERAPVTARLDRDQEIAEARLSAFGEVSNSLAEFNTAVKSLTSLAAFNASQAESSNSNAVTATASSIASTGTYSINVTQLAQQHTLASQTYASTSEAIGVGTLTFRFGTTNFIGETYDSFTANPERQSRSITIDSSNNSLAGIRDAVNKANIGVQATIVDDGSGFRLLFSTTEPGADNSIELAATGSAALSAFNFNSSQQAMTQTQSAQDAQFSINGLAITRSSNLVGGVIPGVTLNLRSAGTGPTTLSVSKDPADLMEKVQNLVDRYNGLKAVTDALTAFDPDAGENGQGSVLTGDRAIRQVMSSVNSTLRSFTAGSEFSSLAEVGVTSNQFNNFLLEFDRSRFEEAFQSDPAAITALFATTGVPSDDNVSFIQAGSSTQPGSYSLEITRMAEVGRYQGIGVAALAGGNIEIDGNNKSFNIFVNGVEVDVALTEGIYATAAELAEEIQRQVNSQSELINSANSVQVTFNAGENRFDISSNRYGQESVVRIVSSAAETANTLGLVSQGRGPYQGRELTSLSTTGGLSSDNFDTALVVDSETQFSINVNGVSSGLLTLPGDAITPVTYNTPDELIAALETVINDAFALDGITMSVGYQFNAQDNSARLVFSTGNAADQVTFADVNLGGAARLGLFEGSGAAQTTFRGINVAGRINGIEAEGLGQVLTAASGSNPATSGYYLHNAPGDVSTSTANDRFRLRVDGVLSGAITLGVLADTSPDGVAIAMQTAINNDPALLVAGKSVTVSYEDNGFKIRSDSRGSTSTVAISSLEGNAGAIFGFATGTGSRGQAGSDASGPLDPSAGLRVRVTGGNVGERGTISYSEGVASKLTALINSLTGSNGVLSGRTSSLNTELQRIAEKREQLSERIAATERRLQQSFLANDIIISQFNNTMSFLESQLPMLEALVTPNRNKR